MYKSCGSGCKETYRSVVSSGFNEKYLGASSEVVYRDRIDKKYLL